MNVFDEMVDDIKGGEIVVAEFDSGLTVTVDYESMVLTDLDDNGFDIVLNGEVLDTIHLLLEARHVSRETPLEVDWDQFLIS